MRVQEGVRGRPAGTSPGATFLGFPAQQAEVGMTGLGGSGVQGTRSAFPSPPSPQSAGNRPQHE